MGDIVPRKTLVRRGSWGLGGIVGGIAVFTLGGIAGAGVSLSVPGLIIGGAITLIGLALSSKEDRAARTVAVGAGLATIVASLPIVGPLAGALLRLSGIGLLGAGIVNVFRFVRGMRSRS